MSKPFLTFKNTPNVHIKEREVKLPSVPVVSPEFTEALLEATKDAKGVAKRKYEKTRKVKQAAAVSPEMRTRATELTRVNKYAVKDSGRSGYKYPLYDSQAQRFRAEQRVRTEEMENLIIAHADMEPKRRDSKRSPKYCSCDKLIDIKGALLCKPCRDSWRESNPHTPYEYKVVTLPNETGFKGPVNYPRSIN